MGFVRGWWRRFLNCGAMAGVSGRPRNKAPRADMLERLLLYVRRLLSAGASIARWCRP